MKQPTASMPGDDEKRRFGTNLRATRERLGLSQREMAERCAVGTNVYNTWENGHSSPQGRVPWLMADVLGWDAFRALWGEVSSAPVQGGRLYTEAEVDARAAMVAHELLHEASSRLRGPGGPGR